MTRSMKDRDFQIIKGNVAGRHYSNNELIRGLVQHADEIESELHEVVAKFGQSERIIDRLTENVMQLQREREAMKVALPREVADDLERFMRIGCDLPEIIYTFASGADKNNQKFADYAADNFHTLLSAIFNGYTVEKTKEERLREGVKKALVDLELFTENLMSKQIEQLTNIVTDFVTEFMAENS